MARKLVNTPLAAALSLIVATAVPASANFVMTPLLIEYLGREEFGRWATIEPIISLGAAALTFGMQYGAIQHVAMERMTARAAIATLLFAISCASLVLAPLQIFLVAGSFGMPLTLAIIGNQIFDAAAGSLSSVMRAGRKMLEYAAIEGGRVLLWLIASVGLTLVTIEHSHNLNAIMLLRLLSTAFIIVAVLWIKKEAICAADIGNVKPIVSYGLPIFGAQLLTIASLNADRYVVGLVNLEMADLTVYLAHIRLAGILNVLLVAPLSLWYPVELMKRDFHLQADLVSATSFVIFTAFAVLIPIVELASPLFWSSIFPSLNYDASVMYFAVLSVAVQALAVVWNAGALRPGHTQWNMLPPVLSGFVVVIAGYAFGLQFGIKGVAIGKFAAGGLSAFAILVISRSILGSTPRLAHSIWPAMSILASGLMALSGAGEGMLLMFAVLNVSVMLLVGWRNRHLVSGFMRKSASE